MKHICVLILCLLISSSLSHRSFLKIIDNKKTDSRREAIKYKRFYTNIEMKKRFEINLMKNVTKNNTEENDLGADFFVDSNTDVDCPVKLAWTDKDIKDLFHGMPKKLEVCEKLWKQNKGLGGKQTMEYYHEVDSNPIADHCDKDSFDFNLKENKYFLKFIQQCLPNTYRFCQHLWSQEKQTTQKPKNTKHRVESEERNSAPIISTSQ